MFRFMVLGAFMMASLGVQAQETNTTTSTVEPIITESTVITQGKTETTLKSPPASAISPTINTSNSDLCTFGVAGAVQTQILGISTGTQITDEHCEMLKTGKNVIRYGDEGGRSGNHVR